MKTETDGDWKLLSSLVREIVEGLPLKPVAGQVRLIGRTGMLVSLAGDRLESLFFYLDEGKLKIFRQFTSMAAITIAEFELADPGVVPSARLALEDLLRDHCKLLLFAVQKRLREAREEATVFELRRNALYDYLNQNKIEVDGDESDC